MLATTNAEAKANPMAFVPRNRFSAAATNLIERADSSRDAGLLDASIAGVVLTFNPRDDEMRQKAERAWTMIRALLADHLFDRASGSPWNGDASVGSATACDLLKKRYLELRALAHSVDTVSFELGSDAEISNAGRALCRLAVKLDDLMERTERRLINKLRQYVFSSKGVLYCRCRQNASQVVIGNQ